MIVRDIILGLKNYFKAFRFIFKNKLAWFFIFPFILSTLLFVFGLEYSSYLSNLLQEWIMNRIQFDENAANWLKLLESVIKAAIWILFKFLFFFIFAYTGGYIVIIILSPVFAWLSEKTEAKLSGREYSFNFIQFVNDIWRGIVLASRNFLIEMLFISIIFISGFIPGLGWLSSIVGLIILFFISAYFYGFSFLDYYIERRKLSVKQSVYFMRKHKGLAIGNGIIFSFTLLFPIIGALLAPFLAIVSVVAAVISMEEIQLE